MIEEPEEDPQDPAPRRKRSEQSKASIRSTSTRNREKGSSDPDIRRIAKLVLKEGNYDEITAENTQPVVQELRKVLTKFQSQSDYVKAEYVDQAIEKVKSHITDTRYQKLKAARADEYSEILKTTKDENIDKKQHWKELIKLAEDKRDEDLSNLQAELDEKYNELAQQLDIGGDVKKIPPKFIKFSSRLVELRVIQQQMVMTERFLEAKRIKAEADELERKEREALKSAYLAYARQTLENFNSQCERKIAVRSEAWERDIQKMKRQYQKDQRSGKRSEDYLEKKVAFLDFEASLDNTSANKKDNNSMNASGSVSKSCDRLSSSGPAKTRSPKNMTNNRIIRPLSERELKFKQRKQANFITYTRRSTSPRTSRRKSYM
ncbi:hypothetical protein TRFO_26298 [Tritrichomonas foetus]|uniref:Uncharacterized protein n=1 Tax=Tritrichomonas foetus TaxID=1144522 RepID=A0A1J4K828_9EUKA|nr:hypothetical protein TRFO_26298 [Tritrichomonas foetus]|eukprot:OHT05860.1 hypothetical protein TRFO_26298 [Tritrichomonas foetus]